MNPKRQRILLLIMLVVLAIVVARRQFFRHQWNEDRDARQEEQAERRDARQEEQAERRDARQEDQAKRRDARQRERDAARDSRQQERDESRRAQDQNRDAAAPESGLANRSENVETGNGNSRSADAGFDRAIKRISYSKHARCRMDCRKIDESEVLEIKNKGKVNLAKTELRSQPDPKYAVEGVTHDNQHVRIVFAQKDGSLVVVTVIDLDADWTCHCN